jgi:lipopolysaccharide transport system ATP-binding protein
MGDTAIRAVGLGKQYSATRYRHYLDLRETLTSACNRVFTRQARNAAAVDTPKGELWSIRHVSFEVRQGEVVALLGHNGAGKTTLLRILSRITEPTEGYAEIRGKVAPLLDVGAGFHSQLTGRENIYVHAAVLGMKRAEIRRKFDEIVAFSGTERFLDIPIKRWSRGMCVRLAFSVAAHLDADVLLVDELLDGADAEFRQTCLDRLVRSASSEGRTVIFVSHDLGYAHKLSNRQITFAGGRMLKDSAVLAAPNREIMNESLVRI